MHFSGPTPEIHSAAHPFFTAPPTASGYLNVDSGQGPPRDLNATRGPGGSASDYPSSGYGLPSIVGKDLIYLS